MAEEKAVEKDDEAVDKAEKSAGKSGKMLIIAIVVIVLAGAGGGGFFAYKTFMAKPSDSELTAPIASENSEIADDVSVSDNADPSGQKTSESDVKDGVESKNNKTDNVGFGDTYALNNMVLNLGNPLENRYLRISVSLEYRGKEEQKNELERRDPQIRDVIINAVNPKTRMELLSQNGKDNLRRELLNRLNEILERPTSSVYLTEFLVE